MENEFESLDIDAAIEELVADSEEGYPDTGKYNEKKEADRRSTAMFVGAYAENGPTFDPTGEYLCGTCKMRFGKDQCTHVAGDISFKTGSCDLYMIGPLSRKDDELIDKISQVKSGYVERPNVKGFGCTRCFHGKEAKEEDSARRPLWCSAWGMHVMEPGCCMRNHGKDDVEAPSEKTEEVTADYDRMMQRVEEKSRGLWAENPDQGLATDIDNFPSDQEKLLREAITLIPAHLTRNVKGVIKQKSLNAVHGRYNPDNHMIEFNPDNFTNKTKMGRYSPQPLYRLCLLHEFGHSVYEGMTEEMQNNWRTLSGWKEGKPPGNAAPYVEKRQGWEPYTAKETPSKDAKFTRGYASKNANEDFADSFSFYFCENEEQVPEGKRKFIEELVQDTDWKPTQAGEQTEATKTD